MEGITCTKCNTENTSVEEIMTDVTVSSEVTEVNDGYPEYGDQITHYIGGEVDRYQCVNCGETLAETIDELNEKMERKEHDEQENYFK